MNKKVVLLGLTVCEVMAASLATVFVSKENTQAFAGENTPNSYVVTIDKSNNLVNYGIRNARAFRMHGSEEYAYMFISNLGGEEPLGSLDTELTGKYSDYAFSWSTTVKDYFMQIYLTRNVGYEEMIDGKKRELRGFPNAYEITTVYSKSSDTLRFDDCRPNNTWNHTITQDGDLITEVASTKSGTTIGNFMDWTLREAGTIYFKSITIKYTCE